MAIKKQNELNSAKLSLIGR